MLAFSSTHCCLSTASQSIIILLENDANIYILMQNSQETQENDHIVGCILSDSIECRVFKRRPSPILSPSRAWAAINDTKVTTRPRIYRTGWVINLIYSQNNIYDCGREPETDVLDWVFMSFTNVTKMEFTFNINMGRNKLVAFTINAADFILGGRFRRISLWLLGGWMTGGFEFTFEDYRDISYI